MSQNDDCIQDMLIYLDSFSKAQRTRFRQCIITIGQESRAINSQLRRRSSRRNDTPTEWGGYVLGLLEQDLR